MGETPSLPQRGLKIALAVSVALNLAVAGVAAGAFLRDGAPRGPLRDLSLGPFGAAFSPEDRRALRRALQERMPDLRQARGSAQAEFSTLVRALRTDPYDPAAVNAALAGIAARHNARLGLGLNLIAERIREMSPPDRRGFADRLESAVKGPAD